MTRYLLKIHFALALLILIFTGFSAQAGDIPKVDSLLIELETPDNEEHHLTILSDFVKYTLFVDSDTAEYFARKFIEVAEGYENKLEIARGENFLGMINYVRGHNEVAIKHYLKAIPAFEEAGDLQMVGILRNNVASAFSYRKKRRETIHQYEKALEVFQELQDTLWIASVQHNLGNEYLHIHEYEKVEEYQANALRLFRILGDSTYVGYCHLAFGNLQMIYKDYEQALFEFNKAAELVDPELDLLTFANIDGGRCQVCTKQGNYSLAEFYCKSGLEVSKKAGGFYNLSNSFKNLAELEKARGNYKYALAYSDTMKQYQDSLSNQEKDADILEMVSKYESDQRENELSINKLKLEASERRNNQFLIGIILMGLLVAIGVTMVYQSVRNNRKLEDKNSIINNALQEKEALLKEIHHRVKNNLQVITSLLSLQSREISDPVALEAVKSSQNRVKSMAMIHQNLYKQDSLQSVDAQAYITNICNSVLKSYHVGAKAISLDVEVDQVDLDVDTTIPLGLIVNELMTNCLKYAFVEKEEGKISVSLKKQGKELILQVKDDGIGIDQESYNKGSSIGLKLIEAFAKKLKASWNVVKDNGTEITFRFNQIGI